MNPSSKDDRGRSCTGPNAFRRQTLLFRLPWIGFCILIFHLSSQPSPLDSVHLFPFQDKAAHLIAYGVLALLTARNMEGERPHWSPLAIGISAVLFSLVFGITDEFHQSFVPGRHASLGDIAADAMGALAGAWVYPRLTNRFPWAGARRPAPTP